MLSAGVLRDRTGKYISKLVAGPGGLRAQQTAICSSTLQGDANFKLPKHMRKSRTDARERAALEEDTASPVPADKSAPHNGQQQEQRQAAAGKALETEKLDKPKAWYHVVDEFGRTVFHGFMFDETAAQCVPMWKMIAMRIAMSQTTPRLIVWKREAGDWEEGQEVVPFEDVLRYGHDADEQTKRRKVPVPEGVGYANKPKGHWRVQFWKPKPGQAGKKAWEKGKRFTKGDNDANRASAIEEHVKRCPEFPEMHAACTWPACSSGSGAATAAL